MGKRDPKQKNWFRVLKYIIKFIDVNNMSTMLFYVGIFAVLKRHRLKTGPRPELWTWDKKRAPKKWICLKNRISSHLKVINFHTKSGVDQGLVFIQIKFENYTASLHFKNSEVGIKKIPICSPYQYETFPHLYAFLYSLVFNLNVFLWN